MIPPPTIPRIAALFILLPLLPLLGPLPETLKSPPKPHPVLLDRSGLPLTDFPRQDFFRHQPITLAEIPIPLIHATLAAEDKRFYHHPGIDYLATARAFLKNTQRRDITSGASTITQQLIKISTPPAPRTLRKKISEIILARRLETAWSKDQILHAYLNRLDYGSHQQGCAAAARAFFDKPLADLSLAECALLAALPQAPSRLNPTRNPAAAIARRNWILDRLASEFQYRPSHITLAKNEPLLLKTTPSPNPIPHLTQHFSEGTRLSIDRKIQNLTAQILTDEISQLTSKNVHHAALVVIKNETGEILALHGSPNFHSSHGGQINGALTPRSAGSTLKPFTYALAFDRQNLYPGSVIADIPTPFLTEEGLEAPKNFDRRHHGPVSLRHALGNSLNVSAMRLLNQIGGPAPLHQLLTQLDLPLPKSPDQYGLGLTIGNAEVTLLNLTNAYATLARLGHHLPPTLTLQKKQTPLEKFTPILSPASCFLVAHILADNQARSSAFGPHSVLRLPFPCAVKTGTSTDFRDNWCLGFTADFTVGVWMGNFDNSPTSGLSGVSGSGPIFQRTMLALHQSHPPTFPTQPSALTEISIDSRTGHFFPTPPPPNQPYHRRELCPQNALPLPVTPTDYAPDGRALLTNDYAEWFQSPDNTKAHAFALSDRRPPTFESLKILTPLPGTTYYLDPELPQSATELSLVANLPDIEWSSETLTISENKALLTPGKHTLTLTHLPSKQKVTCHFSVKSL